MCHSSKLLLRPPVFPEEAGKVEEIGGEQRTERRGVVVGLLVYNSFWKTHRRSMMTTPFPAGP